MVVVPLLVHKKRVFGLWNKVHFQESGNCSFSEVETDKIIKYYFRHGKHFCQTSLHPRCKPRPAYQGVTLLDIPPISFFVPFT